MCIFVRGSRNSCFYIYGPVTRKSINKQQAQHQHADAHLCGAMQCVLQSYGRQADYLL